MVFLKVEISSSTLFVTLGQVVLCKQLQNVTKGSTTDRRKLREPTDNLLTQTLMLKVS